MISHYVNKTLVKGTQSKTRNGNYCFQVFNGVLIRAAIDAKLDPNNKKTNFAKPDIRVGFIPGGKRKGRNRIR